MNKELLMKEVLKSGLENHVKVEIAKLLLLEKEEVPKEKPKRKYTKRKTSWKIWTNEEDVMLMRYASLNVSKSQIAKALNKKFQKARTVKAVTSRIWWLRKQQQEAKK